MANVREVERKGGRAYEVRWRAGDKFKQRTFTVKREADRIGYGVMTQAGFDPVGFVSMFDKLQQASKLNDNGSFPYLRSHPLTTERIADMQARQALLERRAAPAQPDLVHAMMAARSRSSVGVLRMSASECMRFTSLRACQAWTPSGLSSSSRRRWSARSSGESIESPGAPASCALLQARTRRS